MTQCNFCDRECICHINPPCSFCVHHIDCEICGQIVCEDKSEELKNRSDGNSILVCPDCAEIYY